MTLARGYTGQEMDGDTGLINMNARLYDPVLGRFMTADPTIPNVYNPQSLNRYSYVLNNPFRYTDPTGYSFEPVGGGLQYDFETGIALLDDTYYFPNGSSVNAEGDWTFYDPANDAFIDIPNSPDYTGVGEDFFIANDAFSGMSPLSGGLGAEASRGFVALEAVANFISLFNDLEYSIRESKKRSYGSDEELLEALGENGYVFGKRAIEGAPFMIQGEGGSGLDILNLEGLHEHVFYAEKDQLRNLGYFGGGKGLTVDREFPSNISQYRFGPILQGPMTTQKLRSIPGFRPQDYDLILNNCQDYCFSVRQQFGR